MKKLLLLLAFAFVPVAASAQAANPLWHEEKITNYLPHMSWPEVEQLRTRTDMVIIPIAALEQHSLHLPIGTDYLNGLERAKLDCAEGARSSSRRSCCRATRRITWSFRGRSRSRRRPFNRSISRRRRA